MREAFDCLIVGGGVAGAALAFRLRAHGQRVAVVDAGHARLSGPYETLLAPAHTLLQRTGLTALVEPAARPDTLRHGAIWGDDTVVWREPGDGGGLWLARGDFDRALRAAVAQAGASVWQDARVEPHGDHWLVARGAERIAITAAHHVVATGRPGPGLPRDAATDDATMPRTVALTFVGELPAADRGTSIVEACQLGWIWLHAPAHGPASATLFVDAAELREGARAAVEAAMFAASRGPAGRLRERRLVGTTDASARLHAVEPGELRIGDAAARIDPLASQGVEKALAAADHAAAVLLAAALRPQWWPRLCASHVQWERGLFRAHREVANAWYRREQRFANEPFWRRRHAAAATAEPGDDQPLLVDAQVRAAAVLVRQGMDFIEQAGFVHARSGDELTHVGYVPVAPVLAAFAVPRSIRAAVAVAGQDARLFVLPPRAVHGAMVELARRGWLTPAANAASSR